jgi:hypothetical protein
VAHGRLVVLLQLQRLRLGPIDDVHLLAWLPPPPL